MEELREQFQYKEGSIEVCMKSLTSTEQYDLIRMIIASPTKEVLVCTHEHTSNYVNDILKQLGNVKFYQCFVGVELLATSTKISSCST
jgi:hypothetical protein